MSTNLKVLQDINEWRRGADISPPSPKVVGEAIDAAIEEITELRKIAKHFLNEIADANE